MNQGVENLDEEDRAAETARYSSTKELLLKYIEGNSGVQSKRRGWINGFDGSVQC